MTLWESLWGNEKGESEIRTYQGKLYSLQFAYSNPYTNNTQV